MNKRLIAITLVSAMLAAYASTGNAADNTTNSRNLLDNCNSALRFFGPNSDKSLSLDAVKAQNCIGTIQGVRQSLVLLKSYIPQELKVCYPQSGASLATITKTIVSYINSHPSTLDTPEAFSIMRALHDKYPCT